MRIILLRGLGRDQLHWQPLLEVLKENLPNVTIETPDLPGAGVLYKEKSPLKISDYIPYLEKQTSSENQPTLLVGLSLGGMIALEWASQYPDKFAKVVLINSSSRMSYFFQRLNLLKVIQHPLAILGATITKTESAIYQLTCNSNIDDSTIERWVNVQLMHPVSLRNQLRQVLAASRFNVPLVTKLPPVHVIYSKKDGLVSPSCSVKLAQYFDAEMDSHPWAGHDLPQDDPVWLSEKLNKISRNTFVHCF